MKLWLLIGFAIVAILMFQQQLFPRDIEHQPVTRLEFNTEFGDGY